MILGNGNEQVTEDMLLLRENDIAKAVKSIFNTLGFDWSADPNMQGTPKRIAKMYVRELFRGNYEPEPKFTVFPNDPENAVDEMVVLRNIAVKSMCSHHLAPFLGIAHIAYIPDKHICGISKLARVTRWFMRRPQIQEALTKQIAEYIEDKLQPLGVAVVIEAQHTCMTMRGVEEFDSNMLTSKLTGVFKQNNETRAEFLSLIKKG